MILEPIEIKPRVFIIMPVEYGPYLLLIKAPKMPEIESNKLNSKPLINMLPLILLMEYRPKIHVLCVRIKLKTIINAGSLKLFQI